VSVEIFDFGDGCLAAGRGVAHSAMRAKT